MLKAFFSPYGRRPRLEYWRAAALVPLMTMLAMVVVNIIVTFVGLPVMAGAYAAVALLLVGLWSGCAIAIQRLHDQGLSGWWTLIGLVPLLGSLWYLFWNGLRRGTQGPNHYGPDPLGGSPAAVFGDDPTVPVRRKPPLASTIVAWVILFAIVGFDAVVLFQNPGRRAVPAHPQPTVPPFEPR